MPCRVGITTRPDTRRTEWEAKVVGLSGWRIIGTHRSRAAAQEQESSYATRNGCQAHGGGRDANGPWSVYRFDYTRTK